MLIQLAVLNVCITCTHYNKRGFIRFGNHGKSKYVVGLCEKCFRLTC